MSLLLKVRQPTRISVPVLISAVFCLVLVGIPMGGGASPFDVGRQYEAVQTEFVEPTRVKLSNSQDEFVEPGTLSLAIQPKLKQRPVSLVSKQQVSRLLVTQGLLPDFIESAPLMDDVQDKDPSDPRLQRDGHAWALSQAFASSVGADPWALDGIGFPNVETHGPKVQSNYKPYKAVLDWKLAGGDEGEWEPVPAVYCMGLSAQQIADRAETHERRILSYAIEYGVSASLVKAVITKESCFNTKAVSKAGAEGLMQLMPDTARWLKVTDRNDVNQNLSAGIRYLAELRQRFGTEELALAAYNAGPGNVERHGGIPPFAETQQYVVSVMAHYRRYVATSRFANQRISY